MGEESSKPVRLDKQSEHAETGAASGPIAVPRTIHLAVIAIAAELVFTLARALLMRGYTSELSQLLIKSNADADKPKKPYGATQVAHDLSQLRNGVLWQGLLLIVIIGVLGYMLRKQRVAGAARWGLVVIIVLMRLPFAVIPSSDLPGVIEAAGVLMGLASIAVIVLLFVPPSMQYFRRLREANRPAGAANRAARPPARPGLGSLFAPRGSRGGGLFSPRVPPPAAGRSRDDDVLDEPDTDAGAQSGPQGARPTSKPKAKARADEAAVARGAALARSRAKASKSRRTPT